MEKIFNRKILIDSCVLIYCGHDKHSVFIENLLRQLTRNNNTLFISEMVGFEVLSECQNKKNATYYVELISKLRNVALNKKILMIGALLRKYYSQKKYGKEVCSVGDVLIGASAIQTGALLLTANRKDFPREFWNLIGKTHNIHEDENDSEKMAVMNLHLLEFKPQTITDADDADRLVRFSKQEEPKS